MIHQSQGIKIGDTVVLSDFSRAKYRTVIAVVKSVNNGFMYFDYPGERMCSPRVIKKLTPPEVIEFKLTGQLL
jgi:hypothetical protein